MYSFNEYSADIVHTRQGKHVTAAYACLGLIGETGELVKELLYDVLPESQNSLEAEVLDKLAEFITLAEQIEQLKKNVRKAQINALPEIPPREELNVDKINEEIGGVLWYLDTLASTLQTNLGDAAFSNQSMLRKRFKHNPGWMTNDGEKLH